MSAKRGFTLIELSIVLIIIGLLIGGVMITKSMIREAQIRGVIGEAQRYIQVLNDFRDKYHALPGDFSGATALWGTASGGCPAGTGNNKETCNGDGNGRIGNQTAGTVYEEFRAWQHLANANMIETNVTGIAGATYHARIPGTNIPKSQLDTAGWGLTSITASDISSGIISDQVPYITGDNPPNHVLWLGGRSVDATSNLQANVLQGEEAQAIDTKIDDGKPNTGKVVAQINPTAPECTVTDNVFSDYNGSYRGRIICTLIFKTGF